MDKRITVVLADANEEFRTALKQALEATGEFDVVGCAADGLAAAQDIAERKPQLLVMDLLLPGLDGFGVLEQAAKDKVQMKTVVVSALYRDQIVSQAMSRGVSFFMPKPCELTSLLDQMRRAVNEGEESEDESQALEREVTAVIHEVGVPAHATAPRPRVSSARCAMRSRSHGTAATLRRSSAILATRYPTRKESRPTASLSP